MSRDNWNWYLKRDDKEYGPLSHRELLLLAGLGKVHAKDQLWAVGFPSWISAQFMPGLLGPPLVPSRDVVDFSAWQPILRRLKASWLRVKLQIASFVGGRDVPLLVPMIWCSVACVGVLAVAISERTSAHSFALAVPDSSKAEKPVRLPPDDTEHERPPASVMSASYTHIPLEIWKAKEKASTEMNPGADYKITDDAVPLPPRKAAGDPAVRSLQTKTGARSVQRRLRDLGYLADGADGSWGARSRLALKQFQIRAKISPNDGWSRKAERALFSANAPRATGSVTNPIVETLFRHD